jgi:enoyl-CoA hydratase/carnithine racemase
MTLRRPHRACRRAAREGPGILERIDHSLLTQVFGATEKSPFLHLHHQLQDVFHRMSRLHQPIIAALHGVCVGMGLELALAADLGSRARLRARAARDRLWHRARRRGTTRLVRAVGEPRARELVLTGRLVRARTAERYGLVHHVAGDAEALERLVQQRAEQLAAHSPHALGLAKTLCQISGDADAATSFRLEGVVQQGLLAQPDLMTRFPPLAFIKAKLANRSDAAPLRARVGHANPRRSALRCDVLPGVVTIIATVQPRRRWPAGPRARSPGHRAARRRIVLAPASSAPVVDSHRRSRSVRRRARRDSGHRAIVTGDLGDRADDRRGCRSSTTRHRVSISARDPPPPWTRTAAPAKRVHQLPDELLHEHRAELQWPVAALDEQRDRLVPASGLTSCMTSAPRCSKNASIGASTSGVTGRHAEPERLRERRVGTDVDRVRAVEVLPGHRPRAPARGTRADRALGTLSRRESA